MYKERSKVWTVTLSFALIIILLVQVSIFIVGPKLKFDYETGRVSTTINAELGSSNDVYRHVFEHITYTTRDDSYIYWYNEEPKLVLKKELKSLRLEEVDRIVKEYTSLEYKVNIGYAYDEAAYEVISDDVYMLLNYETLDIVHLRRER